MKAKPLPSQEYLLRRLAYDVETGQLLWKPRPFSDFSSERICNTWNSRFAQKPAFTAVTANGYATGQLDSSQYLAHRIIWKMVYGHDPKEPDHINGVRTDNRIKNLRDGNRASNCMNAGRRRSNTSGVGNVQLRGSRWRVRFWDKQYGQFDNFVDAVAFRDQTARQLGFSERHGR